MGLTPSLVTNYGEDQGNQGLKWKNTGALGREGPDEEGRVRGVSMEEAVMKLDPGWGSKTGHTEGGERRQVLPVSSLEPGPSFQEHTQ